MLEPPSVRPSRVHNGPRPYSVQRRRVRGTGQDPLPPLSVVRLFVRKSVSADRLGSEGGSADVALHLRPLYRPRSALVLPPSTCLRLGACGNCLRRLDSLHLASGTRTIRQLASESVVATIAVAETKSRRCPRYRRHNHCCAGLCLNNDHFIAAELALPNEQRQQHREPL